MTPHQFHMMGRFLATQSYARRGGPQPKEDGKRARWENFELGPYPARMGIVGEILQKPLSWHALIFEVDFGSHVVSAQVTPIRDQYNFRLGETTEWVQVPTEADLVALALLNPCNFG